MMHTHRTGPSYDARVSSAVRIALIRCATAELAALGRDVPFTPWELARSARITHVRRRTEWLAGRLAAKWLWLSHVNGTAAYLANGSLAWPPHVHRVSSTDLDAIAPAQFRRAEIRRDDEGAPHLAWDGDAVGDARVSIAHRGGWAVAALNPNGAVGIDVEEVAPRRVGFYDACLSDHEREWIRGANDTESDRLGTLLWALKEACLKTGASPARTTWEMGAIDLEIATPAAVVASSWPTNDDAAASLVPLAMRAPLSCAPPANVIAAYGAGGRFAVGVVALTTANFDWVTRGTDERDLPQPSSAISKSIPRGGLS